MVIHRDLTNIGNQTGHPGTHANLIGILGLFHLIVNTRSLARRLSTYIHGSVQSLEFWKTRDLVGQSVR
jgi:hypothetical protein